jgi:hypothetical protein
MDVGRAPPAVRELAGRMSQAALEGQLWDTEWFLHQGAGSIVYACKVAAHAYNEELGRRGLQRLCALDWEPFARGHAEEVVPVIQRLLVWGFLRVATAELPLEDFVVLHHEIPIGLPHGHEVTENLEVSVMDFAGRRCSIRTYDASWEYANVTLGGPGNLLGVKDFSDVPGLHVVCGCAAAGEDEAAVRSRTKRRAKARARYDRILLDRREKDGIDSGLFMPAVNQRVSLENRLAFERGAGMLRAAIAYGLCKYVLDWMQKVSIQYTNVKVSDLLHNPEMATDHSDEVAERVGWLARAQRYFVQFGQPIMAQPLVPFCSQTMPKVLADQAEQAVGCRESLVPVRWLRRRRDAQSLVSHPSRLPTLYFDCRQLLEHCGSRSTYGGKQIVDFDTIYIGRDGEGIKSDTEYAALKASDPVAAKHWVRGTTLLLDDETTIVAASSRVLDKIAVEFTPQIIPTGPDREELFGHAGGLAYDFRAPVKQVAAA